MVKKLGQIFIALLFVGTLTFANSAFAVEPESSSEYEGIDVSRYQENIDWEAVANAGMEVAIIKSSEGVDYTDPNFEVNYEGAKAAGLKVGFYHFLTATTVEQAREEASFFASIISGKDIDVKPVMDFEDLDGLSVEDINAIALAFAEEVESQTSYPVMVYSNADNATNVFGESLTKYSLWLAQYDGNQPSNDVIWETWAGWQYTDTGSIDGVTGDVDLNIFNDGIFIEATSTEEEPEEQPEQSEEQPTEPSTPESGENSTATTYVVKAGDTLYSIAKMHDTTVSAILANNNLANPNLIHPGVELTISNMSSYLINWGDTLWSLSKKFGTTVEALASENNIENPDLIYAGDTLNIPQ
nr:GH25 family lysozyme [Ureibacillus chungkukjangi]